MRDFAEKELRPIAAEIDHKARFPWEVMEKMGPLKYFGLQAPLEMGGAGLDTISYAIAIEEISRVSAGVGLCLTVHNSVAVYPILAFGTKEQKERFLPDLISGRRIGSFCLTEAGAGSDAGAVETLATEQDDGFLVNGAKIFVTNGGVCGLALIFAKNSADDPRAGASVLMIEKERAGYSVGEIEDLMGMRCNPVASLFLEDCLVPKENLLGKPGQGIRIGLMTLDTGRLGVAAQALGIAQAAFEASLKYAKERRQFGKAHQFLPDGAELSGRHVHRNRRGQAFALPGLRHEGLGQAFFRTGLQGQAVLLENGQGSYQPGASDPRRLRLQQGIRRGTLHARGQGDRNLRRHLGDPAHGDSQGYIEGAALVRPAGAGKGLLSPNAAFAVWAGEAGRNRGGRYSFLWEGGRGKPFSFPKERVSPETEDAS